MKKTLVIIIFLLFCFKADAQDEQNKRFLLLSDFSGGRASHISEFSTPLNKCQIAQNVRVDDEFRSLSKRNPLRGYGDAGGSSINGIHRYYKSDNTSNLIVATGTNLKIGNDSTGVFTNIQTGLTDGARWDFTTYKDVAIMVSQSDKTYKYDGSTSAGSSDGDRTANYLATELGAPFVDIDSGTDLSASSWYQYKVLFYNDTTDLYYYSDAETNKIQTGASDYNLVLSDIPLGKSGISERQIYRTEAQASATALDTATFKYVDTIENNSEQTFIDTIGDGSLGVDWSVSDATNITPLTGSIVNIHNERLFIAGNTDDRSFVFWSDERNPDWFDRTAYYPIRPDDGDEITFLEIILGNLVIGKTNTIQFFYTDGAETSWKPSAPFSGGVGCPAQWSAKSTPSGIVFLGRFGLYAFTGNQVILLSDEITDVIKDIKQSNLDEVYGEYWDNKYLLSYTSDNSGVGYNNKLLIYDLKRKSFVIDDKNINCMTVLESGNDFGALYYGSSVDGNVTSEGSAEQILSKRLKSGLDEGSFYNTDSFGTEDNPSIELAWNLSIDGVDGTAYDLTIDGFSAVFPSAIIDRPSTYGYWLSPGYEINAKTLNKLYWNEDLNSYGDITARIRTASTEAGLTSASWSDNFTIPSGSDITDLTANDFIQISFDLSTSNILYTPELVKDDDYVFKIEYSLEESLSETSVASLWQIGWLGLNGYRLSITRIRVFYEATEGTLSFDLSNIDGNNTIQFDIDLAQSGYYEDDEGNKYVEYDNSKIFSYFPDPLNSSGEFWRLKIYDDQLFTWKIKRIEFMYEAEELVV